MIGETGDLPRVDESRREFQYSAATVSPDSPNGEEGTSPTTNHFISPEQDISYFQPRRSRMTG